MDWKHVFNVQKPFKVCQQCWRNFQQIQGDQCLVCSRPYVKQVCQDCQQWAMLFNGKDPLTKNISLFTYNSFMKEVVTRWKYQGDYVLGEMFAPTFLASFKKAFSSLRKEAAIIPIPLSKQRALERGFNQAYMLASFITPTI